MGYPIPVYMPPWYQLVMSMNNIVVVSWYIWNIDIFYPNKGHYWQIHYQFFPNVRFSITTHRNFKKFLNFNIFKKEDTNPIFQKIVAAKSLSYVRERKLFDLLIIQFFFIVITSFRKQELSINNQTGKFIFMENIKHF